MKAQWPTNGVAGKLSLLKQTFQIVTPELLKPITFLNQEKHSSLDKTNLR